MQLMDDSTQAIERERAKAEVKSLKLDMALKRAKHRAEQQRWFWEYVLKMGIAIGTTLAAIITYSVDMLMKTGG